MNERHWFFDGFTHSHQIGHWVEIAASVHGVLNKLVVGQPATAAPASPIVGLFLPKLPGPMTDLEQLYLASAIAPLRLDLGADLLMYILTPLHMVAVVSLGPLVPID